MCPPGLFWRARVRSAPAVGFWSARTRAMPRTEAHAAKPPRSTVGEPLRNAVTEAPETDEAVEELIEHYTREAGVRSLEREISKIARKVVKEVSSDGLRTTVHPQAIAGANF